MLRRVGNGVRLTRQTGVPCTVCGALGADGTSYWRARPAATTSSARGDPPGLGRGPPVALCDRAGARAAHRMPALTSHQAPVLHAKQNKNVPISMK
eukprot:4393026-Prymnesium_polylepis.2